MVLLYHVMYSTSLKDKVQPIVLDMIRKKVGIEGFIAAQMAPMYVLYISPHIRHQLRRPCASGMCYHLIWGATVPHSHNTVTIRDWVCSVHRGKAIQGRIITPGLLVMPPLIFPPALVKGSLLLLLGDIRSLPRQETPHGAVCRIHPSL